SDLLGYTVFQNSEVSLFQPGDKRAIFGQHSHVERNQGNVDLQAEVWHRLVFFRRLRSFLFLRLRLTLFRDGNGSNVSFRPSRRGSCVLLVLLLLRTGSGTRLLLRLVLPPEGTGRKYA